MPTTLPTITETIDNAFLTTWYEIRAEAADNILNATPIWAALMAAGCMKTQVGSDLITRTIRYGQDTAVAVNENSLLPTGEVELETMARWTFRYIAGKVQRNAMKDRENSGPSKIKDYVGLRLTGARDALEQKFESSMFNTFMSGETGDELQGLEDMVPTVANRSSGTYGQITRASAYAPSTALGGVEVPTAAATNPWWGPRYLQSALASIEDTLIEDMKNIFGAIHNNQVAPNLMITDKAIFDIYENFALDISQIVKDESTMLADLGFEVLRFKGKPLVWTSSMTANHMLFLTTDFIEFVYDPTMWFSMTGWKPIPLETRRIAHILSAGNLISDQLRRHGRLQYS